MIQRPYSKAPGVSTHDISTTSSNKENLIAFIFCTLKEAKNRQKETGVDATQILLHASFDEPSTRSQSAEQLLAGIANCHAYDSLSERHVPICSKQLLTFL